MPQTALIMFLNVRLEVIKEKLARIGFDRLMRLNGFDTVYRKKIKGFAFLFGFMKMYSSGEHSLSSWADGIGQFSGAPVSKQAIDQKFTARHSQSLKAVLEALMAQQYRSDYGDEGIWHSFERVLIQDSTCWGMPLSLKRYFPGPVTNKGKQKATARLQVCYDVKADCFYECELQSFRDNDQKHAASILRHASKGDLVIRDLGYFSQDVFADLSEKGIFFVSRLSYRVGLYNEEGALDYKKLTRGKDRIDTVVLLGAKRKMRVRLVGVRLSKVEAAQRRRKAKTKDNRSTPTKAYLTWLGWSFLITNLPKDTYSPEQVSHFYRLRWRIEILFKGFKSGLNWSRMFKQRSLSYERVLVTIYAMLIYVLLCWQCYTWFIQHCRSISLVKFLKWYRLHYEQLIQACHLDAFLPFVVKYCSYERRKERKNYHQMTALSVCF